MINDNAVFPMKEGFKSVELVLTDWETFEVLCEMNDRINSLEKTVKMLAEDRHARR